MVHGTYQMRRYSFGFLIGLENKYRTFEDDLLDSEIRKPLWTYYEDDYLVKILRAIEDQSIVLNSINLEEFQFKILKEENYKCIIFQ